MEDEFEDNGFEFPPPPPPLQPNYMEPAFQHRQQPAAVSLVLPPFWTENAAGWFAHAESRFRTKRIFDEWDRFDLTVAALSKESIQSVFQLVTSPSENEPYTALKEGLLHNHQAYRLPEDREAPRAGWSWVQETHTASLGDDGAVSSGRAAE